MKGLMALGGLTCLLIGAMIGSALTRWTEPPEMPRVMPEHPELMRTRLALDHLRREYAEHLARTRADIPAAQDIERLPPQRLEVPRD
jgi:uncharacterized membrane-anchored protein YhcB (DUF1043 family)